MTPAAANRLVACGALAAAAAVACGAFGAHALRARLAPELLAVFQTGVQYHAWHALGMLGAGVAAARWPGRPLLLASGWLMLAGIVLFSGSLYLLSVTGTRWLGAITPLGGLCFIAAWLAFAAGAWKAG